MRTSTVRQVEMGQGIASKVVDAIVSDIDEAVVMAVTAGVVPFDDAPQVKRQMWIELAILCAERAKAHGS